MHTIARQTAHCADEAIMPIAVQIPRACELSGLSRSEIYRRLATGDVEARKSGNRTLVIVESLRAHIERLPRATFRPLPNGASKAAQIAA